MCTVAHKMNTVLSVLFIRLFPPTWKGGLKICAVCSIDLEHYVASVGMVLTCVHTLMISNAWSVQITDQIGGSICYQPFFP